MAKKSRKKFSPLEILTLTNAVIREEGWLSKKEAAARNKKDELATCQIVDIILHGHESEHEEQHWGALREKIKPQTDENVAREVIRWVLSNYEDSNSDYMYSMAEHIQKKTVGQKAIPILCSAVMSFKSQVRRSIAIERDYSNEFFGEVGKRYQIIVKVKTVNATSNCVLYKAVDENRNCLIWFADEQKDLIEDVPYRILATVTRHGSFAGLKQTRLTNVRGIRVAKDGEHSKVR